MLSALMAQEECTTGLLAETSGVSGGNLFQQLNELYSANLIFQPSRGRYRLTEFGRIVVGMLSWAVSNPGKNWAQPGWFENNPEKQEEH
jgi:predicted transcriptional regulator